MKRNGGRARAASRRRCFRRLWLGPVLVLVAACVPPTGGWDLRELERNGPALDDLPGQRLGDLVPHPAPIEGGLALVACRWDLSEPIDVRFLGPSAPEAWRRLALDSLSASVPDLELNSQPWPPGPADPPHLRGIDVVTSSGPGHETEAASGDDRGPSGVGDTLVECDVSIESDGRVRGRVERAQIRMRNTRRNQIDEWVPLADVEWIGAFEHELAHALGFSGHVAAGDSVLVANHEKQRAAGRAALAGKPWRDETLESLYRLPPGMRLGRRAWTAAAARWVQRIEDYVSDRSKTTRSSGPWASAGDREARLEWRIEGEAPMRLRIPHWPAQLERNEPIRALPDRDSARRWRRFDAARSAKASREREVIH